MSDVFFLEGFDCVCFWIVLKVCFKNVEADIYGMVLQVLVWRNFCFGVWNETLLYLPGLVPLIIKNKIKGDWGKSIIQLAGKFREDDCKENKDEV